MNEFLRNNIIDFSLGVSVSPNEYLAHSTFFTGKRVPAPTGTLGTFLFLIYYLRNNATTKSLAKNTQFDIYHATFYDPSVLHYVGSSKLVVTVYDMIPERFPELFDRFGLYGKFVTHRWIDGKRRLCEEADVIIAISEQTKKDLISTYRIRPEKTKVTYPGITLTRNAQENVKPSLPEKYVLFVGTRNTYKNFPFFLESLASLVRGEKNLYIVCIGGGTFSKQELSLIKSLDLEKKVIQKNVRDEELAACYAHASAFVFPSLYEGFGMPIIESFACGCPAILANTSCFHEVGGDAAVYFDPHNKNDLHDAVTHVLSDRQLRVWLVEKGQERAKQFTWAETARATAQIYKDVLGART